MVARVRQKRNKKMEAFSLHQQQLRRLTKITNKVLSKEIAVRKFYQEGRIKSHCDSDIETILRYQPGELFNQINIMRARMSCLNNFIRQDKQEINDTENRKKDNRVV